MRSNVRPPSPFKTHEGAQSPILPPVKALRRSVMGCLLFEDTFYESGQSNADRIRELCAKVSFPELAQIARDARGRFKLRHVPLLLVREALRHHKGRQVGDLIHDIIQRPDEMGELLAIYRADGGKSEPAQLKIGLARAWQKFSAYELAKYNREGIFTLRDVAFLCHIKIRDKTKGRTAAKILNSDFYPVKTKSGFPVREYFELGEKAEKLDAPDTWEVALSKKDGISENEKWTRLLTEKKLGALAVIRNLRNMVDAKVPDDLIRQGIGSARVGRVLPHQILAAARVIPAFEPDLEQMMFRCLAEQPKLSGKTAILVDRSGSMQQPLSSKSTMRRIDVALSLAMILRETAESCRVFAFSDRCSEAPARRGFALSDAILQSMHPSSTFLGQAVDFVYRFFPDCERLIVVTDEQSADRPAHPRGKGYIINVAAYSQGIGYGPWITVDGWSEAVLDFIRLYEEDEKSQT